MFRMFARNTCGETRGPAQALENRYQIVRMVASLAKARPSFRIALFNLAVPGIDNILGGCAIFHNGDFVNDPAIRLFKSGAFPDSFCSARVVALERSIEAFSKPASSSWSSSWPGRSFTDYLSGPGTDGTFPNVVALICLYLVGQLICLAVKTDIDDPRVAVFVRRYLDRLRETDFHRFRTILLSFSVAIASGSGAR
jgi:hypothetical protein